MAKQKAKQTQPHTMHAVASEATSSLRRRLAAKPSSDIHRFVFEMCSTEPGASVSALRLHLAYSEWGGQQSVSEFDQVIATRCEKRLVASELLFVGINLRESDDTTESTGNRRRFTLERKSPLPSIASEELKRWVSDQQPQPSPVMERIRRALGNAVASGLFGSTR